MISADHASDLTRKARNSIEKTLNEVVEPAIIDAANKGESIVYIPLGNATYKRSEELSPLGWYVVSDKDDAMRQRVVAALDDFGYDAAGVTKRPDDSGKATFGVVVEW